jgi:predicted nuclease with TOPRIM domain
MFFKKWWKEILLVLVVLGAIWYVQNLRSTVKDQAKTITQMEITNKTLTESNKTLTSTVTANNKTIAEIGKGAAQTKEAFDKLNGNVAAQSHALDRRLKDLLNRPAPVTCNDTITYMIDAVPSYKQ